MSETEQSGRLPVSADADPVTASPVLRTEPASGLGPSGRVPHGAGDYVERGATISTCGTYRYRLWREWRGHARDENWHWLGEDDGAGQPIGWPKSALFVMLNPSTADGEVDDPTIRRCVGYAKAWGFDRMEVINLFAFRATNPKALLALNHRDEPWGVDNQRHVSAALSDAGLVVCAWGAHGGHIGQDEVMLGWIEDSGQVPHALRLTKDGHPSHPLYLPADLKPFEWGQQ